MRHEQLEGFFSEFEKVARSPFKDFLAGVDPTGTKTLQYGMNDARKINRPSSTRRAIGTAGGLVGGAAVIPAGVGGLIGGIKGAVQGTGGLKQRLVSAGRGFVSGAVQPYRSVYRGVRTGRALKAAQGGARLSKEQAGHIGDFVKHEIPGGRSIMGGIPRAQVSQAVGKLNLPTDPAAAAASYVSSKMPAGVPQGVANKVSDRVSGFVNKLNLPQNPAAAVGDAMKAQLPSGGLTAENIQNLVGAASPAQIAEVRKRLGGRIAGGLGMLGLSGAIGGGSAYLQYGKGANIQQQFDRQKGQARALGAKYGK